MASTDFWSNTSTKLGVVSALLGIILSGAATYKIFAPDPADRATAAESTLKLQQLAPKIEMSYVSMASSIYYASSADSLAADNKRKNLLFLDYPLLSNELGTQDASETASAVEMFDDTTAAGENTTTYLVLQNRGKATPENIKVVFKRYTLSEKASVVNNEAYEKAIEAKKKAVISKAFSLPIAFETGKGILIPLFISARTSSNSFNIISKVVYVPDYISYTNPLTAAETRISIRPMKDPVRLANGIEGRG